MIIFLYGQDTYRSREKLKEIISHYQEVHKSGLNLRLFDPSARLGADGQKFSYQDLEDEFRQLPMFQEKKLLIIKNFFQNKEFKESFLENSKKFLDSNDIIIFHEEGEISAQDSFYKFLVKNAKSQEFQMLGGAKLRVWAKKEFEKLRAEINPEALPMLVNYAGNNLWRLSGEIRKLAALKSGEPVEPKDVSLMVKPEIELGIFKTIEAMALRNKKQALYLINEHLEKGDSPLYLLSMINFQIRNLLIAKRTGRLSGHPYFVRKTLALANGFTLEELKNIYYKIFETDLKIKTGQLDPRVGLDLLIAEV